MCKKVWELRFGSPHEVIKEVNKGCLETGKKTHKTYNWLCLERGMMGFEGGLNEA